MISSYTIVVKSLGKNLVIKLNVGGKIFLTTLTTLLNEKDTFFTNYFSDRFKPSCEVDGSYFIDRNYKYFEYILDHLRGKDLSKIVEEFTPGQLDDFAQEVAFYQIRSMYKLFNIKVLKRLKKLGVYLDEINTMPMFDANYCSNNATIIGNYKVKKHGITGWNCCILATHSEHFQIKLINKCEHLMVGMATKKVNLNGCNYNSCGWYYQAYRGNLFSQDGQQEAPFFNSPSYKPGTIIEVILKDNTLSFKVNHKDIGVAFRSLPNHDVLFPAFELFDQHCEFEFVDLDE
ncbi:hypothetical protein ABK040_012925 [Willaertia magna]